MGEKPAGQECQPSNGTEAEFYYNFQLDNEEENKVVITTGDRVWVDISMTDGL